MGSGPAGFQAEERVLQKAAGEPSEEDGGSTNKQKADGKTKEKIDLEFVDESATDEPLEEPEKEKVVEVQAVADKPKEFEDGVAGFGAPRTTAEQKSKADDGRKDKVPGNNLKRGAQRAMAIEDAKRKSSEQQNHAESGERDQGKNECFAIQRKFTENEGKERAERQAIQRVPSVVKDLEVDPAFWKFEIKCGETQERGDGDDGAGENKEDAIGKFAGEERPDDIKVFLNRERPKNGVGDGDAKERSEIRQVNKTEAEKLERRGSGDHGDENGEEIGGNDAQRSPDVETLVIVGARTGIDKDASDQETGEDEKKIYAKTSSPGDGEEEPLDGRKNGQVGLPIIGVVDENHEDGEAAKRIQLRHDGTKDGQVTRSRNDLRFGHSWRS